MVTVCPAGEMAREKGKADPSALLCLAETTYPRVMRMAFVEDLSSFQSPTKPATPPVALDRDISSPDAHKDLLDSPSNALAKQSPINEPKPRRSKSFLRTLTNKLRMRRLGPEKPLHDIPDGPEPARAQDNVRRRTSRVQAVPITLPNDAVSRRRREEALRARGLLPARQLRDLSAIEADEDHRIDALQINDVSSSGCDSTLSEAKEIAQSWKFSNSEWLSHIPLSTISDKPVNPVLEVALPSINNQESRPALPSPLSPEGPEQPAQQSDFVPLLPSLEMELPPGIAPDGLLEDVKTHPPQSAPSPSNSKTSRSRASTVSAKSQTPLPPSSQLPVSPSRQPKDLQPTRSPRLSPSPSLPAPVDFLPASPSPSLPSLLCSPSSESSESTDRWETIASPVSRIKGRRDNDSPVAIKCSEGGILCQEVILEASEPFPEDDLDPFAGPSSPPSVDPVPRSPARAASSATNPPRRKALGLFDKTRRRAPTVGPSPSVEISKLASMVNLRRSASALHAPVRQYTTLSPLDEVPNSSTPSPLNVTIHNGATILAEASQIDDDEVRRLSELAFLD
ncbi:hypothetical protein BJV78DRAFT_1279705 [Lactifluus subvellereus]|nr:hypothetical protein BJV78DRAFT_1279705 [Lactifluus subvellereus]